MLFWLSLEGAKLAGRFKQPGDYDRSRITNGSFLID